MSIFIVSVKSQNNGVCRGFESRLSAGQRARVIPQTASNNVRAQPDSGSVKVGQIPPGEEFDVLEGPYCSNSVTWWKVNYEDVVGWTGEGDTSEYWVEPLPQPDTSSATGSGGSSYAVLPLNNLRGLSFGGGGGGSSGYEYYPSACYVYGDSGWMIPRLDEAAAFIWDRDKREVVVVPNGKHLRNLDVENGPGLPGVCLNSQPATTVAIAPDGEMLPAAFHEADGGYVYYLPLSAYTRPGTWQLEVDDYHISMDVPPIKTPLYLQGATEILLIGYQPYEKIVVLYYAGDEALQIQTDERGIFLGDIETSELVGAIIAETSETLRSGSPMADGDLYSLHFPDDSFEAMIRHLYFGVPIQTTSCINVWNSQLKPLQTAQVIPGSGPNNLRVAPDASSESFEQIPEGQTLTTLYGPLCDSQLIAFWLVNYKGQLGWTAEGEGGTYWLEPVSGS